MSCPERDDLALAVACDPETKPEVLEELSRHASTSVVRGVAQNPNTPLECLLALVVHYPGEVLGNPSLPLLRLEHPDFFSRFSFQAALALLRLPELPEDWLWGLLQVKSSSVQIHQLRARVAAHPRSSEAMLEQLLQQSFAEIQDAGRLSPRDTLRDGAARDQMMEQSGVEEILVAIARRPEAPLSFLEKALQSGLPKLRQAAAEHPRAPKELIEQLKSAGANEDLSEVTAPDEECSPLLLARFGKMGDFPRLLAARHPSTPPATWRALLRDLHGEVRAAVASSRRLSDWMCELLAADGYRPVREALVKNPNTPGSVLDCLADDEEPSVLSFLLWNPRTPPEAFWEVARRLEHCVHSGNEPLLRAFAESPYIPSALFASFAVSGVKEVRALASRHPQTPKELLSLLQRAGSDPSLQAPCEESRDADMSPEELSSLASLGPFGEMLAAHHPNASPALLQKLSEQYLPPFMPRGKARLRSLPGTFRTGPDLQVLTGLVKNPSTPSDVLERLWEAFSWSEALRQRLSVHPNLPQRLRAG